MIRWFQHRIRQVKRTGLKAATALASERGRRALLDLEQQVWASILPTGLASLSIEKSPRRIVPQLALDPSCAYQPWCRHEFDLLGSGPKEVRLTLTKPSIDLPRPWRRIQRDLEDMLPSAYRPIDWQIDPTSGYRWSARMRSKSITYGNQLGVEIKWPWELARMQHLPAMAGLLSKSKTDTRQLLERELRAQIIDFVMQNPPEFGVGWTCAMDVGIRAANLALAVDLARAAGTNFDEKFLKLVSATLRDHGRFLVRNLEWGANLCSNHYLADIVGLLFIAAYLPTDAVTSGWITFAGRELVLQLRQQFHPDGTNFEASTCYHRLSTEMIVYGVAMMLYLGKADPKVLESWHLGRAPSFHPGPPAPPLDESSASNGSRIPFSEKDLQRLAGMGAFTRALLRRDGSIPLIGDDDSGRFVRLGWCEDYYSDLLNHAHIPAAVDSLFIESADSTETLESSWLRDWVADSAFARQTELVQPSSPVVAFPQFGLYVWNQKRYRLTLRCGAIGQNGNGGHAHSDQLALTLDLDGMAVVIDPGTGVYTPNPAIRNRFRSAAAHSTVFIPGKEPNEWLPGRWGLFSMRDLSCGRIVEFSKSGATCEHNGFGVIVRRQIKVAPHRIELVDEVCGALAGMCSQLVLARGVGVKFVSSMAADLEIGGCCIKLTLKSEAGGLNLREAEFSPHYGEIERSHAICWAVGRHSSMSFDVD